MSAYTEKEMTKWSEYLLLLMELARKQDGAYNGLASPRPIPCPKCGRKIPPGIPKQVQATDWIMCPACITARSMVIGLERELFSAKERSRVPKEEVQRMVRDARERARLNRPAPKTPTDKMQRLEHLLASLHERQKILTGHEALVNERLMESTARALAILKRGGR